MTRLLQTFKNAGRATAAHTTRTIPRQIRDRKVDKDDADDRQHDECDECDECEECDEEHEELRQQPRTTPTKSSWWPGVGEDWWRRLEVSKSRKVSKEAHDELCVRDSTARVSIAGGVQPMPWATPAFSREKRSPAPDGAAVSTRARLAATAAGGRVPAARDRAASCDQQHHSEEQHPSRSFKEKVHLFGETTF